MCVCVCVCVCVRVCACACMRVCACMHQIKYIHKTMVDVKLRGETNLTLKGVW